MILDGAFSFVVRSRALKTFSQALSQTSEGETGKDTACRCGFRRLMSLSIPAAFIGGCAVWHLLIHSHVLVAWNVSNTNNDAGDVHVPSL